MLGNVKALSDPYYDPCSGEGFTNQGSTLGTQD